jgi:hypothetical protein
LSDFYRRDRYIDTKGARTQRDNIISISDMALEELGLNNRGLRILQRILEGEMENRRDILFLFEEMQNCEKKIETNTPSKVKVNFSDLSLIMSDLIDFSTKNSHILRVGYNIQDEIKFCIILDSLNFDNLKFISYLDVELSKKNPNIVLTIEPFSVEEKIDSDYKMFYYVKKEILNGSTK